MNQLNEHGLISAIITIEVLDILQKIYTSVNLNELKVSAVDLQQNPCLWNTEFQLKYTHRERERVEGSALAFCIVYLVIYRVILKMNHEESIRISNELMIITVSQKLIAAVSEMELEAWRCIQSFFSAVIQTSLSVSHTKINLNVFWASENKQMGSPISAFSEFQAKAISSLTSFIQHTSCFNHFHTVDYTDINKSCFCNIFFSFKKVSGNGLTFYIATMQCCGVRE